MNIMSQFKISTRIYAGFGLVLALLLLLAGVNINSNGSFSELIEKYESVSTNATRVANIQGYVNEMRRNVVRVQMTGDEKSHARVKEMQDHLKKLIPEAIEATVDPKRLENLKRMQALYEEYSKKYERVPELFAKKETKINEEMNVHGSKARQNYSQIMKSAEADNDVEASALTGHVQEDLMLVRIAALRFLNHPSEANKKQVDERMPALMTSTKKLADRLNNPNRKQLATEAEDLAEKYKTSFDGVATTVKELDTLVNKDMTTLGIEFSELAQETLTSQQKALEELKKETFAELAGTRRLGMIIAGIALLLGAFIAYTISGGIVHPINWMTEAMRRLADGDKTVDIPCLENKDSLGIMAKTVLVFKEHAIEKERLEAEQAEAKRNAEAQRKAAMREMADSFERQVGGVIEAVTSATVELQASSKQMAATATETSAQATSVASSAEESSSNVQAVASATEELANSIKEIATQMEHTRSVAIKADEEAKQTTALMGNLSDNVTSVSGIIDLINDIASQTNLLALNATIEAARAGDAGKGFAVVASEVKNLASQTAKATEEVASKIAAIQSGTADAVKAISSIAGVIAEMGSISSSVAAAVEEQGAATGEISRNVEQASTGTREVSKNIGGVETAAQETGAAANQISSSANELSRQADMLKTEVRKFLDEVRSDKEAKTA